MTKATSGSPSPKAICRFRHLTSEARLPALQTLLDELTCGDDDRAEQAAAAMAALGPEATPVLIQLLNQGGDDVRWWAVRTLGAIAADEAGDALSLALSDPEPSVRQAAALGLCGRPLEGAILESLAHSLEDPDPLAGRLAAEALAGAGTAAIPFLQAALRSRRPSVRLHAVRGLVSLGSPEAVPALISALDDASPQVVHWAEEGLEQLGLGMVVFNP